MNLSYFFGLKLRHCRLGIALILFGGSANSQPQLTLVPSVVRAGSEATISSVIPGILLELPYEEGDLFKAGDVLAVLDCLILEAEAQAARADSDGAAATLLSRKALQSRGGIGRTEVAVSAATAAAAQAIANAAELKLKGCVAIAPFDGRVAELKVNEFEFIEASRPILFIISTEKPDLEIIAPAEWLRWIKNGWMGEVQLEATQRVYEVSVTGIGPIVDPVSRTVKLTAEFSGDVADILPGMSGLVKLEEAN